MLSARTSSTPRRAYVAAPPDTLLFFAVASLVGIGLVMIFSASSATAYLEHHDVAYYAKRQIVWLVVGLIVAYGAYKLDYHQLKRWAPYLLVAAVLSLVLVLVPHVGVAVNGARRWVGASSITFQPSEFAKLALVIYLCAVPLLLFAGFGVVIFFLATAYILGREYFELAAMRFRPPADAKALRKRNAGTVYGGGLLIAAFVSIPIVNLATPLFAMALMVHLHKRLGGTKLIAQKR